MKGKTSDSNKNCFSFPGDYSWSLSNICTIDFVLTTGITVNLENDRGLDKANSVP